MAGSLRIPGRLRASPDTGRAVGAGLAGIWRKAATSDYDPIEGGIGFRGDRRGTLIGDVPSRRAGVHPSPGSGMR